MSAPDLFEHSPTAPAVKRDFSHGEFSNSPEYRAFVIAEAAVDARYVGSARREYVYRVALDLLRGAERPSVA